MMWKVLGNILCDLDPKEWSKVKKAGICYGVPWTAALVKSNKMFLREITKTVIYCMLENLSSFTSRFDRKL